VAVGPVEGLVAVEKVDTGYREILAELEKADPDLAALAKRYQQAKRQDYFNSELGDQVRQILVKRRGLDNS
jgi:hypothetical protein